MKNIKLFILIIILILIGLFIINPIQAFVIIDQNQSLQSDAYGQLVGSVSGTNYAFAQSFIPNYSSLVDIRFWNQKNAAVGTPNGYFVIELRADNLSVPSTTNLASKNFSLADFDALPVGWNFANITYTLTPGVTYWIVGRFNATSSGNNYRVIGDYQVGNPYPIEKISSSWGSTWTTVINSAMTFQTWVNAPLVSGLINISVVSAGTNYIHWAWNNNDSTLLYIDGYKVINFDANGTDFILSDLNPNEQHSIKIYNSSGYGYLLSNTTNGANALFNVNTNVTNTNPNSPNTEKIIGIIAEYIWFILGIICLFLAARKVPLAPYLAFIFGIIGLVTAAIVPDGLYYVLLNAVLIIASILALHDDLT